MLNKSIATVGLDLGQENCNYFLMEKDLLIKASSPSHISTQAQADQDSRVGLLQLKMGC